MPSRLSSKSRERDEDGAGREGSRKSRSRGRKRVSSCCLLVRGLGQWLSPARQVYQLDMSCAYFWPKNKHKFQLENQIQILGICKIYTNFFAIQNSTLIVNKTIHKECKEIRKITAKKCGRCKDR